MKHILNDYPKKILISYLEQAPLFQNIKKRALSQLVKLVEVVQIDSGELLIKEGDKAGSVYILAQGRLRTFIQGSGDTPKEVNEISPGGLIGELALMTDRPRQATVIAIRSSILLEIKPEAFKTFALKHPEVLFAVSRHSIERLISKEPEKSPLQTITFVPTFQEGHKVLTRCLQHFKKMAKTAYMDYDQFLKTRPCHSKAETLTLTHDDIAFFSKLETEHDVLIFETSKTHTAWSNYVVNQSDRICILVDLDDPHRIPSTLEKQLLQRDNASHAHIELILCYRKTLPKPAVLAYLETHKHFSHHLLKIDNTKDHARLMRYLTGNSLALALSGGGARAHAHFGAYKALTEAGFEFDMIAGTSGGAIVGALLSLELSCEEIIEKLDQMAAKYKRLIDYTLPIVSLLNGRNFYAAIKSLFPEDIYIEHLKKRFLCISSNLSTRNIHLHTHGKLCEAVRASSALPGVLPPMTNQAGELLIDGGIINNLPVDKLRPLTNGGKIIALSTLVDNNKCYHEHLDGCLSGWRVLYHKLNPWERNMDVPTLGETITESMMLSSKRHHKEMLKTSDLAVMMDMSKFKLLDFLNHREIIQAGYEATQQQLDQLEFPV